MHFILYVVLIAAGVLATLSYQKFAGKAKSVATGDLQKIESSLKAHFDNTVSAIRSELGIAAIHNAK